ncbi:MAG: deoxyguanosinetriphosphate triphosphohydrolase [Actinobacteria bacterium HGW-Actinobacteria-4]|nr:MAG: deoxyguanosinetriphosphate triphosphohydrolase [Actinobacteria bacterium HGW-Actinobacteria-4]
MSTLPPGYVERDVERWVVEPPKNKHRTPFERDRARIVHSSALRRLGAKTQVLGLGSGDFVRTRLTHTLEVAQIGRELGKSLGCDPDLVDSACLAHDLGHPPFGHNGERALDEVARDIGGFEGNAQTLRLITRLEPKSVHPVTGASVGLNLTRASLDAAVKYPWRESQTPTRPDGSPTRKFGVYEDDMPIFEWLREGAPERGQSFEAQVMDLADDISYSVHDVEDSVVHQTVSLKVLRDPGQAQAIAAHARQWYGRGEEDALLAALERLQRQDTWMDEYNGTHRALAALKDMTSQIIGRLCQSVTAATRERYGDGPFTRHHAQLVVPQDTRDEILILKGIAVHFLMAPREKKPEYRRQREKLAALVPALAERGAEALEPHFAASYNEAADDAARLRVAVDQVASLTDKTAYDWHHKYCEAPRKSRPGRT